MYLTVILRLAKINASEGILTHRPRSKRQQSKSGSVQVEKYFCKVRTACLLLDVCARSSSSTSLLLLAPPCPLPQYASLQISFLPDLDASESNSLLNWASIGPVEAKFGLIITDDFCFFSWWASSPGRLCFRAVANLPRHDPMRRSGFDRPSYCVKWAVGRRLLHFARTSRYETYW